MGSDAASIKGTTFAYVHADLNAVLAEGRLSRERVAARLTAEDLALLDEKTVPTRWYPIHSYERMVELLAELEAPAAPEAYLVGRGVAAFERLAGAGTYQQLDASSAQLGPRVGNIVITVASMIYNFGRWEFEAGDVPGRFRVLVRDCRDFPEVARLTTQGFIEAVSTRVAGQPIRVTSHRPRPDEIVFDAKPLT